MKYFNVEFPNIVMMTGAGPSHRPVSHVSTEFSSFRVKHHRNRYVKLLLSCCDSCHQISSCHWLRRRGWTRKTSRWTGWSRCWGTWSWSRWEWAAASLISFLSSCVWWVEWLGWQSQFMTSVCPQWYSAKHWTERISRLLTQPHECFQQTIVIQWFYCWSVTIEIKHIW